MQLGIRDIFSPLANLSGIFPNQSPVSVKDIIHKAKIEIDEKGAKAAAATGKFLSIFIVRPCVRHNDLKNVRLEKNENPKSFPPNFFFF